MRKWANRATIVLLVVLVLIWVGAKIHFFTFEGVPPKGYISEHWPFWASMATVGALLFLLGFLERSKTK